MLKITEINVIYQHSYLEYVLVKVLRDEIKQGGPQSSKFR